MGLSRRLRRWTAGRPTGLSAVHLRSNLLHSLAQIGRGSLNRVRVILLHRLFQNINFAFNFALEFRGDLITLLPERLFNGKNQGVGLVTSFDVLLAFTIFLAMLLGLSDHLFNFAVAQAAGRHNLHTLILAGGFVLGSYVQNTVSVNIKSYLDLGEAARRGRQTIKNEFAQALVIGGHRALTLDHVDFHLRLVIAAVEKIWLFLVGMVVLRSMSGVATRPSVSMLKVNGVTSSSSTSFT